MRAPESDAQREQAQARLAELAATASGWTRYISDPMVAQPGSSLARDDQAFPEHPCSHIAWTSIVAAIDCLDQFLVALTTDRVHDTGHRVLARTAFIGGAQAGWVLHGPREQRVRNGLRTAWDDLQAQRKTLRGAREALPSDAAGGPGEAAWQDAFARLDRRQTQLEQAATIRGMTRGQVAARPGLFEMLNHAVAGLPETDRDLAAAYAFTFARLGASAHTMRWSSLLDMVETRSTEEDDTALVRLDTTLADLAEMSGAATLLLSRALERFAQRATP